MSYRRWGFQLTQTKYYTAKPQHPNNLEQASKAWVYHQKQRYPSRIPHLNCMVPGNAPHATKKINQRYEIVTAARHTHCTKDSKSVHTEKLYLCLQDVLFPIKETSTILKVKKATWFEQKHQFVLFHYLENLNIWVYAS